MKNILFASDLDNTLLYSYKHKKEQSICVEFNKGKKQGFMTERTIKLLSIANKKLVFIPITTRSIEQYLRIKWPDGCDPEYAVTTNGANLLYHGQIDKIWQQNVFYNVIKQYENELYKQYEIQMKLPYYIRCRIVDNAYLFVYCKDNIDIKKQVNFCQKRTTLKVISSGRKIYFFPPKMDKGFALNLLKKKIKPIKVISAGDSIIDIPMLIAAEHSFAVKELSSEKLILKHNICYCDDDIFSEFVLKKILFSRLLN